MVYVDQLVYLKVLDIGLRLWQMKMMVYVDHVFDLQVLTCRPLDPTSRRVKKIKTITRLYGSRSITIEFLEF